IYFLLFSYLLIVVYPMFWLFYSSLKSDQEIFLRPFHLPSIFHLHWENFSKAWIEGNFRSFFGNSVIITFSSVAVTTFLAAMTAYALSRFYFRAARPLY